MMNENENPLAELETVYLDGDWDRAFRRAGNSGRASLDLIRIALLVAADVRAMRAILEAQGAAAIFPPKPDISAKGLGGK